MGIVGLFVICLTLMSSCMKKTDVVELRKQNAYEDMENLYAWQEPIVLDKPLNLYDVVDIALDNNLDMYAQNYELEAQERIANAENLRMLPPLTIDAVWSYRSNPTAAFQKSIVPDNLEPPLRQRFPQLSSIQTTTQADFRETIRFIDTALAYFRTKQQKRQSLALEQRQLRARQKLILDITDAYWKALVAKNAIADMEQIIQLSLSFQDRLKRHIQKRLISAVQGLQIQARLVDQQIQLEAIRYQYQTNKAQLAGLMGLLPCTDFELTETTIKFNEIQLCQLKSLEETALFSRPELSIKDLEEKIAIDKIRESIVPMFPDISSFIDDDYDGNPFLVHHYWWSIGVRATWNLFLIPLQWQQARSAQAQQEFARLSRLALSVGVLSQVHLAYLNYRDLLNQYKLALRAYEVRSQLALIGEKVKQAGEFQGIDAINLESDALLAKIQAWRAYANLQIAREQLNYAIGRPLQIL